MIDAVVMEDLNGLITQSEEAISLSDALIRLRSNPDFIRVIEKGYLTDLALQLVKRKGQDSCVGSNADLVEKDITSIGRLNYYFESIHYRAMAATQSIMDARRAIDEIESGEVYN